MKRLLMIGLFLTLAACTARTETMNKPSSSTATSLTDFGPAPELTNEIWLNVDTPLRLADLRCKVVAIEMWTFG